MIDYETYFKIHDRLDRCGLTIAQTARDLGLHPEMVSKWSRVKSYRMPARPRRTSRLDPYVT